MTIVWQVQKTFTQGFPLFCYFFNQIPSSLPLLTSESSLLNLATSLRLPEQDLTIYYLHVLYILFCIYFEFACLSFCSEVDSTPISLSYCTKHDMCNDNKGKDFKDVDYVAVLNYTLTKDSHE